MGSANERMRYYVTPSLIGGAHTQNDPWLLDTRGVYQGNSLNQHWVCDMLLQSYKSMWCTLITYPCPNFNNSLAMYNKTPLKTMDAIAYLTMIHETHISLSTKWRHYLDRLDNA